jgi:hypothetical protein
MGCAEVNVGDVKGKAVPWDDRWELGGVRIDLACLNSIKMSSRDDEYRCFGICRWETHLAINDIGVNYNPSSRLPASVISQGPSTAVLVFLVSSVFPV